MSDRHISGGLQTAGHQHEGLLAGVVFGLMFLVLLLIVVSASALGLNWRSWFPGTEHFTSLFDGVRKAANSVIPLMFM